MSDLEAKLRSLPAWQLRRLLVLVRDQIAGLMAHGQAEALADAVILNQLLVLNEALPEGRRRGNGTTTCAVAGCDRFAHTKGYCTMHYGRLKRTGSTEATKIASYEGRLCKIAGCSNRAIARGLCDNHYRQWVRRTKKKTQ